MKSLTTERRLSVLGLFFWAIWCGSGLPAAAQPLTGGSFVLVGAPAAAATMTGGTFRLAGYVASSGADTSSGESFDLTCGLIGVYVATGGPVPLKIQLTPAGQARIWWAPDVTGYELESTTALGPDADWQPVGPTPSGNEYFTPPLDPARFFRLRKR